MFLLTRPPVGYFIGTGAGLVWFDDGSSLNPKLRVGARGWPVEESRSHDGALRALDCNVIDNGAAVGKRDIFPRPLEI